MTSYPEAKLNGLNHSSMFLILSRYRFRLAVQDGKTAKGKGKGSARVRTGDLEHVKLT